MSARNAPKNMTDEPRSWMTNSSTIAVPQTASSGPRCFSGGNVIPAKRRAPTTSTWRVSRR